MPIGTEDWDAPVAAVFNEPGMTIEPEPARLRLVLWRDGRVL